MSTEKLNQISTAKKKISNLRKLLIGLFTILSIGFGAAMHMLTDIEQELTKAETHIQADMYLGENIKTDGE